MFIKVKHKLNRNSTKVFSRGGALYLTSSPNVVLQTPSYKILLLLFLG